MIRSLLGRFFPQPEPVAPATATPVYDGFSQVYDGFSQATLWAWLDAHGIAFREPVDDLTARYGLQTPAWPENRKILSLADAKPLLPDLAEPPSVYIDFSSIGPFPPASFHCYIRRHKDVVKNVALARAALTAQFGPPNFEHGSNAIGCEWSDPDNPRTSIRLLGFPRSDPFNQSPNPRHKLIKGSATEASIQIFPNFDLPPSAAQLAVLSSLRPVFAPADHARTTGIRLGGYGLGIDRACPDGFDTGAGFWVSADASTYVCVSTEKRFVSFSPDEIETLELDILKPAKGGGGISLNLTIRQHGVPRAMSLMSQPYGENMLGAASRRVAEILGQDLKTRENYDC